MLQWIMMSMSSAVFTFPQDRVVILKERATASYRLSAYFMAMTVADLPVTLIMPALYMLISYWMAAWSLGFVTFVLITLIAMVGVMNGQAFGYLIGASFDDLQIDHTVMMVVMSLLMLVGGFFNPNIPSWLSWVQYISPFYYALNAAMQVIFKEPIPCDGSNLYCEAGQTSIPAQSYLSETLHIHLPLWVNLCVLFLFIVAPRLLAYIVLRRKKAGERE
jgi:ABC-type multidrug transport system permease subunit